MKRADDITTADRILDVAESLVETRGFSGFSYADIAEALSIRKPSIHHHFPTKAKLAERMLERYNERFDGLLAQVDAAARDEFDALRIYAGMYGSLLRDHNRMCLCGMMAAEVSTLPPPVRRCIRRFFDRNEEWLSGVLAAGRRRKKLSFRGKPIDTAQRLLSSLEGALLVARAYDDSRRFDRHVAGLLVDLKAGAR